MKKRKKDMEIIRAGAPSTKTNNTPQTEATPSSVVESPLKAEML